MQELEVRKQIMLEEAKKNQPNPVLEWFKSFFPPEKLIAQAVPRSIDVGDNVEEMQYLQSSDKNGDKNKDGFLSKEEYFSATVKPCH